MPLRKCKDSANWRRKQQIAFSGELTLEQAMNLADYVMIMMTSLGTHVAFLDLRQQMPECIPAPALNRLRTCQPLNRFWFTYPTFWIWSLQRFVSIYVMNFIYCMQISYWTWCTQFYLQPDFEWKYFTTELLGFHFTLNRCNLVAYNWYFKCLCMFLMTVL